MNIGAQLRASREARGLSLDVLAQTTRVRPHILAAIERNDVSAVPPRPFGRGFVRAYAREIGLDPDQTARDYFAQFAPPPEATVSNVPSAAPQVPMLSRRAWAWAGAGALAIVVFTLVSSRSASSPEVAGGAAPVGTSGSEHTSAAVDTPPAAPAVRRSADISLASTTQSRPLTIVLKTTDVCWVTASTDGRRAIYRLLPAGTLETLQADREISIVAGNAGGITWTINGRMVGAMGAPHQIRTVRVTPPTAETMR